MQWSDINFAPSAKTLRQFAALWLVFFAGQGCWQAFGRERWLVATLLLSIAVTVGSLGIARPALIRPLYVGWMVLAFPIGWTLSRLLLAFFFYGIFTPLGLLFRLAGRDVLRRRFTGDALTTYWTTKPAATDVRSYFRQF
jgi:Saxitoxin biosynthesis operon protein SxtJ